MKKLICFLIGHRYDKFALDNGVEYCTRCKYEDNALCDSLPEMARILRWWFIHATRIRNMIDRARHWIRRCPDCGRRFNRCDETVDHVPF